MIIKRVIGAVLVLLVLALMFVAYAITGPGFMTASIIFGVSIVLSAILCLGIKLMVDD